MTLEAFYLPVAAGKRFCLLHAPDAARPRRGAVVYVHPFAEEMNKSRRAVALQARALAQAGYAVLQIDLHGCGESSGDFCDASWVSWIDDVVAACAWLEVAGHAQPQTELWLWGLRTGCLIANAAAPLVGRPVKLLFWQPVVSGKQFLNQFLRLKVAGEMMGRGGAGMMEELRAQLARGEPVEIAGYALSPALADGLAAAELAPASQVERVEWLEVSGREGAEASLSPVATTRIAQWTAAGHAVRASAVGGPSFWQTAEIAECPALVEATALAMSEALPA